MQEIWKPINRPFLRENVYFVSNFGRIKREDFVYYAGEYHAKRIQKGGILAQSTSNTKRSPKGYKFVVIWGSDKKQHSFFVHRLVAEAFFQNWNESLTVNHINEDTHDNSLSNLELLSQSDNNKKSSFHSSRMRKVRLTHVETGEQIEFPSVRQAYLFLGVEQGSLDGRLQDKIKTKEIKGYIPEYI